MECEFHRYFTQVYDTCFSAYIRACTNPPICNLPLHGVIVQHFVKPLLDHCIGGHEQGQEGV